MTTFDQVRYEFSNIIHAANPLYVRFFFNGLNKNLIVIYFISTIDLSDRLDATHNCMAMKRSAQLQL